MTARVRREFKLVGVNCELDLHAALEAWAEQNGKSLSWSARELLRAALTGEGAEFVARDIRERGYKDGYRDGLRDLHVAVKELDEKVRQ